MKHRLFVFLIGLMSFTASADSALVIDWIDLIPESERVQFDSKGIPIINHDDGLVIEQSLEVKIRPELNNTHVKIPGFVIPLNSDADIIKEFLLVPYFGACIHVPPPPLNQIIYVEFEKGAPLQDLWDIVYVDGVLKTETKQSEFAQAGYQIIGKKIEPYTESYDEEYEGGEIDL